MASGSASPSAGTSLVLCKYFASNACRRGDSCPFSHDRDARADNVCRFYLAGKCAYGSACRYDHKRPPSDENKAPKTPSGSSQKDGFRSTISPSKAALMQSIQRDNNSATGSHKFSANAPEFVPSWMKAPQPEVCSYASATGAIALRPLCPYFETGNCDKGGDCELVHGIECDLCGVPCLHPADANQRAEHRRDCVAAHEAAMEEAFAEARSAGKVCGICMENIRERELRFGILEGCRHCFCLECIRQWRKNQNDQFEKKTVRSCPECRTHSDFVIPAKYWVEEAEDKKQLIAKFRENTKQKQCKYLKAGELEDCPFGNKCFYKHEMPDGTIAEGESPRTLRRRRRPLMSDYLSDLEFIDSDSDSDDNFSLIMHELISRAYNLS